ncbi:hypothetical protein J2848_002701 [Azospirillum lipoferum]|uniref:DUF1109 family protein n=1 Tax=Azospirillum lipoferum TaxID=193 RepID=A0A5A9GNS0_AZOLI|nr:MULTISPECIES: NrsF family protein [Azospirillum]KAA0596086.1 DUF1109 family protein [Azospirillum lipoferum]MCP1611028.1 hypothetical protein [Azospirillum lipoferum]MDW5533842.1 NrsF family protein [Azospirillum sp. NL1]
MRTEDLIDRLVLDPPPRFGFGTVFMAATLLGILVAGGIFLAVIGVRPDIGRAAESLRFLFKFAATMPLALGALGVALRLSRPGMAAGGWRLVLGAVPVLLATAVALELHQVPASLWQSRLVGANAGFCLSLIPLMAFGPLALLITVMRRGAPERPALAGGFAGLAAGGIAATFYALHCPDDSPLFVAAWYSAAILVMGVAGCLAGHRFLRW